MLRLMLAIAAQASQQVARALGFAQQVLGHGLDSGAPGRASRFKGLAELVIADLDGSSRFALGKFNRQDADGCRLEGVLCRSSGSSHCAARTKKRGKSVMGSNLITAKSNYSPVLVTRDVAVVKPVTSLCVVSIVW